jgi:ubiquinone/menaquinone biosynthesis C-methylase UbiE
LKYSEGLEEFYDRYYIAPQALEYGERRGWVVTADAEVDSRFPEQGFDVVTMIEFLEHIPDPDNFLRSATRWLRPGGALYLTTPNANSINRRLIGLDWSIFNPPERLTIWTARGLSHALARAGLRPRRIRTEGFNPSEILARRVRPKSVEVNRNQTAVVINQAFSSSSFRRAIKTSINHCLSALRVGDSLKVWAVHNESRDA